MAISGLTDNPIVLTLLINIILLFLGCIMDMAPIILIATPILLPLAKSIGIDPVQFGIIIVLNCGIGLLTPPVGTCLFIGSAVSKVSIERIVKAALPFYVCMIVTLLAVSFIPQVSLFNRKCCSAKNHLGRFSVHFGAFKQRQLSCMNKYTFIKMPYIRHANPKVNR